MRNKEAVKTLLVMTTLRGCFGLVLIVIVAMVFHAGLSGDPARAAMIKRDLRDFIDWLVLGGNLCYIVQPLYFITHNEKILPFYKEKMKWLVGRKTSAPKADSRNQNISQTNCM